MDKKTCPTGARPKALNVPKRGKQRAPCEKAACPKWESNVPIFEPIYLCLRG